MTRLLQIPVFLGALVGAASLSAGCLFCNCPPVEVSTFPSSFTVQLEDITAYDEDWNLLPWDETDWADVSEGSLSRSDDIVVITYVTDAGTFEAELQVDSVTSPLE